MAGHAQLKFCHDGMLEDTNSLDGAQILKYIVFNLYFVNVFFSYMFLEYSSPVHAQQAVKMTNGYKLDKAHTFAVNLFADYEK